MKYILAIFLLGFYTLSAQSRYFDVRDYSKVDLENLRSKFGINKTFPEKYELAILLALSQYPELKDTRIDFEEKMVHATMVARPAPLSLFKDDSKRRYKIFFNKKENKEGLILEGFSLNAKVGVIGHELAHIVYYINTKSLRIIRDGVNYSRNKFRRSFERATDYRTIEHGLGWQLYEFSQVAINRRSVSKKYLERKRSIYLLPEEILDIID
ncbi:MAG: hypothetical protein MRY83_17900 [Flavobacteriales bacterium]|nr:hypothetical protein [Flavobacteriales bacterium]